LVLPKEELGDVVTEEDTWEHIQGALERRDLPRSISEVRRRVEVSRALRRAHDLYRADFYEGRVALIHADSPAAPLTLSTLVSQEADYGWE